MQVGIFLRIFRGSVAPHIERKAPLPKGGCRGVSRDWGILCRYAAYRPADDYPSTAYAVPLPLGEGGFYAYNNFTNYAVSICKLTEIIPQYLHFKIAVI